MIALTIRRREKDLGGFTVGRVLPFARRRMVGPFIFFDEMGPAHFKPGMGIDVRPHPHIGLATVTYLFAGEIRHRDSLGFDQVIRPGDVNWMTAGRGIVHSERTDDAPRKNGQAMHGIQTWVALPAEAEETSPAFHHHAGDTLPVIDHAGVTMRLIAGSAFGKTSPVTTFSPIFYLAIDASSGSIIPLTDDYSERALYVISGSVAIDGTTYEGGTMVVFNAAARPEIEATADTRAMALGGEPVGERHIWWNLVASDPALIDAAREDWAAGAASGFTAGRFTLPPDEDEFIPPPTD